MPDCIFCKIVSGEVPANKVYEDDNFLAFLNIVQKDRGACLVVPKTHYRWTYDVPNFGEYFEAARNVGFAIKKGLEVPWISFLTLGLQVPHAHIHVIPHYSDTEKTSDAQPKNYSPEELQEIADQIKKGGI